MTSIDPLPIDPADIGRDNDVDGTAGSNVYLSEVKVINITPHEVTEIKTSVITLVQDAFPVTEAGDPNTMPISVFASDVDRGYVQWEPMGDLYPATAASPLGSYKYLRVKWDCYIPAGSNTADYTTNGTIPGPYDYYAEKTYTFRATEPLTVPNFTLTNGVLSSLGYLGSDKPTYFEFSAHGYVNKFNFHNGLYGQDKQTDYPAGSALLPATREVIYDRFYDEVGSINEPPHTQGGECLAKEYMVHGRIVPELDFSSAAFQVVQQGSSLPIGSEVSSIFSTSGRDAPPFWYNFHYELQHEKNIIPFTFMWGVSLLTYDAGPYDPQGATVDYQDIHGRVGGTPKTSNNNGPRLRSMDWVNYFKEYNSNEVACPNIFHSQDDITFSVVGPDAVCHASSVNVCAVYTDTDTQGLKKTILNWFDKRNQTWQDVELFGYNYLPSYSVWVLRGCIHINNNYLPVSLNSRDTNSQASNKLEKTWAIDQNFGHRKLFTPHKNTYEEPPEDLLQEKGYVNKYQTAAYFADKMWDSPVNIGVSYPPAGTTQDDEITNPYYGLPNFYDKQVGFLKNLHEPWAMNPIGLAYRPGIAGEQPGFNFVGTGGLLANAGLPDARFLEACTDLEWNRNTIEAERDGKIVDQFSDQWISKRQIANFPSVTFPALNDSAKTLLNSPSYTGWLNKTIDSPEFQGSRAILDSDSILGYVGTSPAYHGSDSIGKFRRGYASNNYGYGTDKGKTNAFAALNNTIRSSKPVYNNIGYPVGKQQNAYGYPAYNLFYNTTKAGFTASHAAFGHMLSYAMISGDKITLDLIDHFIRVVAITHNDGEHARRLFDNNTSLSYRVNWPEPGREEGRPLHALVCGIGITNNRKLAERALYTMSRRFWNHYHVQNFEHTPTGIPGKPWISVWYPPWGGGQQVTLNSEGIPEYNIIANGVNAVYTKYYGAYGRAGDLALRLYNMAGLKITDLNPNFVSSNAASWWWHAVQQQEYDIWVDKYGDLRDGKFIAPGLSAIGKLRGAPNGSVIADITYKIKHRFIDRDDPFRYMVIDPPPDDPNRYVSSIPEVTGVPASALKSEVGSSRASLYSTQGYQQALIFPYISPLAELITNYENIYRERALRGIETEFATKGGNTLGVANEYLDTAREMKAYFARVAKSIAKNILVKIDETSQVAPGKYGKGYFYSPYSPSKLYENFTDSEMGVVTDSAGNGDLAVITEIDFRDKVKNPDGSYTYFQSTLPTRVTDGYGLGAYILNYDSSVERGRVGVNPFGTGIWVYNAIQWSWDMLYKYADLTDADVLYCMDRLKSAILDGVGPEKFDIQKYRTITDMRNTYYDRLFGVYGWPSPGNAPNSLDGLLGDPEILPWFVGTAEEIWRDRELNLTLKTLNGSLRGETSLSTAFNVIRGQAPQTHILQANGFTGSMTPSSLVTRFGFRYPFLRDQVNESFYPLMSSPQVTSVGGGGGAITHQLIADVSGSTRIANQKLYLGISVSGDVDLENDVNVTKVFIPITMEGSIPLSLSLETEELSLGVGLSPFTWSGTFDVDINAFNVFSQLPTFSVSSQADFEIDFLSMGVSTQFSVGGQTDIDSAPKLAFGFTDIGFSGEMDLDALLYLLYIEGDLRLETSLDSAFQVVAGSYRGLASDRDFAVSSQELSVDKSSYANSIASIDSTYTNLRSRQKQYFEKNLFNELLQRSEGSSKVTEIYKDTLQFLINRFSDFVYINDQDELTRVPCWHGSSERVVAKLKQESTIVLPVMSVFRSGNTVDAARRRSSSLIVYDKYWDKDKQRAVRVVNLSPVPINISYKLNVWTKYQEDMDQITEQIHRAFNPDIEIKTKYNSTTKAFLTSESDSNEANIPDAQDRVIKKVFDISVESYIPNPKFVITNTGKIESYNSEVYIPIK